MADIKTIALPLADIEYDSNNEALTRRTIEQAIEDINVKITTIRECNLQLLAKLLNDINFY